MQQTEQTILRYRLPILRKNVKMCLLMKKIALLTLIIVLIASAVLFTACENKPQQISSGSGTYITPDYKLTTLTANDKVVGVRFYGEYFGRSDIAVSADIYSDPNFVLDFKLDADDASLSQTQLNVKAQLLNLVKNIHSYIVDIDKVANTFYDGNNGIAASDIYLYNAASYGETIEISKYTYDMLQIAREMYNRTKGAFNPAVYRLVDLWGFSSRVFHKDGNLLYDRIWNDGSYPTPEDKYIKAFSSADFIDFSDESVALTEQDGKYYVTKNVKPAVVDGVEYPQWLDLGGIAKGYVVDGIKSMLAEHNITRHSVDSGSSSQAYGKNYNGANFLWGVMDSYEYNPFFTPPTVVEKELSNVTVSTSGQYVRKYVTDGVEYAHILDGSLGAPAQTGVKSVTIVAPESYPAGNGDCLTTALTVMGRDKIIDFMNGYLKEKNIKIIVIYETADGQKQIITNYAKEDIKKGDTFDNYALAVKRNDNGEFVYDFDAKAPVETNNLTWLIITLGVVVLLAIVVVVVLHFVKGGHSKVARNVLNAKRDKPFKLGDIGAYLMVAVLIVVLFLAIFGGESKPVNIVKVYDFSNSDQGELLYVYNVARNEGVVYDSSNGWNVDETKEGNTVTVKFSRTINDEEHYDIMTITRGSATTVKMIDATCPDKACVYNSPAIKSAKWGIVCNPNKLKIISE